MKPYGAEVTKTRPLVCWEGRGCPPRHDVLGARCVYQRRRLPIVPICGIGGSVVFENVVSVWELFCFVGVIGTWTSIPLS